MVVRIGSPISLLVPLLKRFHHLFDDRAFNVVPINQERDLKNPTKFNAPKGCKKGKIEYRLESSDEVDVWFMYPGHELAIEVKSIRSSEQDHRRGVFQCVKYRALMQAQSHVLKSNEKIRTMLVSEKPLSRKLTRWARILRVEVKVIKPLR
ncbi:hypothetical protein V1291_000818 [Nitrobacteraceae bacterium AZCC 1564]